MNKIEKLHKIKTYLSRFETYVRLSNLCNEFDINRYAEDFIIPILNAIYSWNLLNSNKEDKNNSIAIDLIDRKNKIAIQVTSDTRIEKIKTTLAKLTSSAYKSEVKKIYFYFLLPKQKRYTTDSIARIIRKKIKFNVNTDTFDNANLYDKIKSLTDESKIDNILNLLEKEFSDFTLKDSFSFKDYDEFKTKYTKCCLNNFSRLNFFGLSIPKKPREIELYQLFVEPNFTIKVDEIYDSQQVSLFDSINEGFSSDVDFIFTTMAKKNAKKIYEAKNYIRKGSIEFKYLFNFGKHLVILGSPGAGKSSLIKYSICKIVEDLKEIFINEEIYFYLPIRVELHKYNRFKKEGKGGIIEYLLHSLIEEFQLLIKREKIEYYLRNFPTIIFFDGLDEIFDIQERLSVRNDIENFIQNNNIARTIVTCRYESYEEVRLNPSIYKLIDVEDFNKAKIKEYVVKWYNIEEINEFTRNLEIKNCLEQLKSVSDELKKNPLLLSLILILYRNEQDLPTSRLEIYEGCAHTLVDSRDKKEKKLDFSLKISNSISIFSNVAYLQFKNEILKSDIKIDYSYIKNFISDLLLKKGEFEDKETADEAAREFLEYAKLRSIYFENKFTHKTFYEYFTSYFIYINFYTKPSNKEGLLSLITENIGIASWHVILELLIYKIDQNQIDFEIIDSIVDEVLKSKPEEAAYFFSGILKHIRNISPAKTKTIIGHIIYNLTDSKKIKESDSLSVRTYFDNLKFLISIKKYRETFFKILNGKLFENAKLDDEIYNLICELKFVLNEKDLNLLYKEIECSGFNKKLNAKFYILNNLELINDSDKTMKIFETFHDNFGPELSATTYQSDYGQTIFNDSIKFSWIIHLINQTKKIKDFDNLYSKLRSFGIKDELLHVVIKSNLRLITNKLGVIAGEYKDISGKTTKILNPIARFLVEYYFKSGHYFDSYYSEYKFQKAEFPPF